MSAVMKAYFFTRQDAQRAGDRLGIRYSVSTPVAVTPVQGRPWRIEITLPDSSQSMFPNPTLSNVVVGIVLGFQGVVHTQDQP